MQTDYDLIIIGSGPAGMTAGIYAKRAGINTLIIEKGAVGGQVTLTQDIENYPGMENINGFELSQKMFEQVTSLAVDVVFDEVIDVDFSGEKKKIVAGGVTYTCYAVILSMGAYSRGLGLDNEFEYVGGGVSYCAVCDGNFFKNKTVAVVGGGNTALEDVIYLSNLADKIYHIHRRNEFRADEAVLKDYNKIMQDKPGKIEQVLQYKIDQLKGKPKLQSLILKNVVDGTKKEINVDGLFVAIGRVPQTEFLNGVVELSNGYIKVDDKMQTNIKGVFAAGDIVEKNLRQIVTATSDGAIAATNASLYIKQIKNKNK